jgi:hypothetical protein
MLCNLLNYRVDDGEAVQAGISHPDEHQPIIERGPLEQVHALLAKCPRRSSAQSRRPLPVLLPILLIAQNGRAMSPIHWKPRRGGSRALDSTLRRGALDRRIVWRKR